MEKLSDREVKIEVERKLEEIKYLEKDALSKGLAFSAPNEQELNRKIKRETADSPYIYAQSWTSGSSPGSPALYIVHTSNPDPNSYYPMFVSIFFGVANFLNDIGEGIGTRRDVNWPYISSEPFFLGSGASSSIRFDYTTPSGVSLGTYLGNSIVWRGSLHDKGTYFDRGLFYITLS